MDRWIFSFLALVVGLAGCAVPSTSEPAAVDEVRADVWEAAHAGCEGLLGDGSLTFAPAEGNPDLIVALDGAEIVCVDTATATEDELIDLGRSEDAREVAAVAAGALERSDAGIHGARMGLHSQPRSPNLGDPSPQPDSRARSRANRADPSPQPDRPDRADPSPQPDCPGRLPGPRGGAEPSRT